MGVNGVAAAQTLLSYRNIRHGYCLYYVWQAYDAHGADTRLSAGTATEAWNLSQGKHPGDRNPPAGVPVFWGPKAGSAAGDVVISLGGGRVACTDYPNYGQVGIATIDQRERQIGRPYLGWAERIFDVQIDFDGSSGAPVNEVMNQQSWLNAARGEKLAVDGEIGPATVAAFKRYQTFLRAYGYSGDIDGQWGAGTQAAHQRYYDFVTSGGKIAEDGELGPATIRALQAVLGVSQDGEWGPATTTALQNKLNAIGYSLTVDGDLGPATIKALQTFLLGHQNADGQMGPQTIRGLQHYLNNGGNFPPAKNPPKPKPEEPSTGGTEADFTPDLKTPGVNDFPAWIKFDTNLDPDGQKADLNKGAAEYYKNRYNPIESHTHWWGEPGKAGSHDGNVNHIKNSTDLSVNFVVSENRITLMVPLNKIALTTGARNPFAWKSENDPTLSEKQYKTMGYLHYIVEKLNPSLLNEPIRLHKEFYATSCSDIDVKKVRDYADKFRTGALDPATGETPKNPVEPNPEPGMVEVKRETLLSLVSILRKTADQIEELVT